MLDSIREIGIFMIAAQAVVHFAPGKQYEKYIKSVAGIVILLLFLRPFLQLSGAEWREPGEVLEKLTDMPAFPGGEANAEKASLGQIDAGLGRAAVSRMEAEVETLLNRELNGDDYRVKRVSIQLAEDPLQEGEWVLSAVKITMTKRAEREEGSRIGIDEIVIGNEPDAEAENVLSEYRRRFAALLGIEEKRVEVGQDG